MANKYKLSSGCLKKILTGGQYPDAIVQILGSKKIQSNSAEKERYRMLISDGVNSISFAMVTTANNEKFPPEGIPNNTIIKIFKSMTSLINNSGKGDTRVLLILEMDTLVLGDEVPGRIGNPTPLTEADLAKLTSCPEVVPEPEIKGEPKSQPDTTLDPSTVGPNGDILYTIASLTPYQNRWWIKVRVTSKSPLRTWSNSKGEGKVFNADLLDNTGEIRAIFFKDLAEKYYDYLQVDKMYYISRCFMKAANKQYSNLHEYELSCLPETVIQACEDSESDMPAINYKFTPIEAVLDTEANKMIDVIGVCKEVGNVQTLTARSTARELIKRDITLVDKSNCSVTLTLWGESAQEFNGANNPVVVIKGARVHEFAGGKSLTISNGTQLRINPEIKECYMMRSWYDNEGENIVPRNVSARTGAGGGSAEWMWLSQAHEAALGKSEKGDYYQVAATILLIRNTNLLYKACPNENCNKKVVDSGDGSYRCEKCDQLFNNFKFRILGSMNIGDWSGNQWVSMFNDESEKILGHKAQEIGELMENDKIACEQILSDATFKQFIFKCRAKTENYGDEERLKTVVTQVDPVNRETYQKYLVDKIQEMLE